MRYDVLREWFKFRPTTAGQTVVLRTGTWHKVATIHTRDSLASALVCCLMLLLLMGWCNVGDSSQRIQHTRTDLEMLSCRSIGCDPALLPGTPPRVCPFRNVLLSERKHRSQFCGLPLFLYAKLSLVHLFCFFFSKLVTFSVHDVSNEMFSERSECNKTIIIFLVLWFRVLVRVQQLWRTHTRTILVWNSRAHTHDEWRTSAREPGSDLPALLVFGSRQLAAVWLSTRQTVHKLLQWVRLANLRRRLPS